MKTMITVLMVIAANAFAQLPPRPLQLADFDKIRVGVPGDRDQCGFRITIKGTYLTATRIPNPWLSLQPGCSDRLKIYFACDPNTLICDSIIKDPHDFPIRFTLQQDGNIFDYEADGAFQNTLIRHRK
jgi:hypothetical protein